MTHFLVSWLLWGLAVAWAISFRNPILFILYGVEIWTGLFAVTVILPIAIVFGIVAGVGKLIVEGFRR